MSILQLQGKSQLQPENLILLNMMVLISNFFHLLIFFLLFNWFELKRVLCISARICFTFSGGSNTFGCSRAIIADRCRFFNSRDVETSSYSKPFNLNQKDATKLRKSVHPLLETLENMVEKMFPENAKHLKGTESNECRLLKGGTLSAFTGNIFQKHWF